MTHRLGMLIILALMSGPGPARAEQRKNDEKALLALHEAGLRAHLGKDLAGWLGLMSDPVVSVSRGSISFSERVERDAMFESYLGSTRFRIYRDMVPPVVKVSADGTLGWVIVQIEAEGVQTGRDGAETPLAFQSAWIELYEKHEGQWRMVGNVSNFKE